MRFGTEVLVTRGGGSRPGTKGSKRTVLGVLVGRRGHESYVRLLQDDRLDTVGWNNRGQVGHWSSSVVTVVPKSEPSPLHFPRIHK